METAKSRPYLAAFVPLQAAPPGSDGPTRSAAAGTGAMASKGARDGARQGTRQDPTPEPAAEWTAVITDFIRRHTENARAEGVVIGMSGGIDSAVTASLCVRALGPERVLGFQLPHRESDAKDVEHGVMMCEALGIEHITRDITPIVQGIEEALGFTPDPFVHGNCKARARMVFLYAEAQGRNRLVCGTGNKSELLVGYFTKHGDGGCDMLPIGDLYKTQVYALAAHLDIPVAIRERPPSAGLHPGQTDEEELGMTYHDLDRVLKSMELNTPRDELLERTGADAGQVDRIEAMVRASEHKRQTPRIPKIGARTVGIDWRRSVHWG